jgi:hypothetical protein
MSVRVITRWVKYVWCTCCKWTRRTDDQLWLAWLRCTGHARVPATASSVVAHQGADEKFGDELHDMRNAEVSPELITDIELELEWGLRWHNLATNLQVEIDRIFLDAQAALLSDCTNFEELTELVLQAGDTA